MSASKVKTPRISLNKLAEFASARAGRQREILRDQKYPTDFKGLYYKEADEAVSLCLASNLEDVKSVEDALKRINETNSSKIGTQRRLASNADALESFLMMLDDIDFGDAEPALGAHTAPKLTVQGVEISVRPEIILRTNGRRGPLVGAVKVHFPRTYSLDDNTAGLASAVTNEWCKVHLAHEGQVSGALCPVIDVGAQRFYPGAKSIVQRLKEVDAICRNISALWPTI